MARRPTRIALEEEERQTLRRWLASPKADKRLIQRGSVVLLADQGVATTEIARRLKIRPSTASRWRARFAARGLMGLQDLPRKGKPRHYDAEDESRVLVLAASKPPRGSRSWTGDMISGRLGDVSADFVWKVLRRHHVTLRRRRERRVPVAAPLEAKTLFLVGLFLSPPENALAIALRDERTIADTDGTGLLLIAAGASDTVQAGTPGPVRDLAGALNAAARMSSSAKTRKQPRRHFLAFMDRLVSARGDEEIHVFLNTISTHKPSRDRWLLRHPRMRFHYLPSFGSWLAQLDFWAQVLFDELEGGNANAGARALCRGVLAFSETYDKQSRPFDWIVPRTRI